MFLADDASLHRKVALKFLASYESANVGAKAKRYRGCGCQTLRSMAGGRK